MSSEQPIDNAQEIRARLHKLIESSEQLTHEQRISLERIFAQLDIPLDIPEELSPSLTRYAESEAFALSSAVSLSIEQIGTFPILSTPERFIVTPFDKGGQVLSKGIEFQDIYTAFLLTKFLDVEESAILLRIEGAEDVDLITKQGDQVCEWYYQIKTVAEGRNWTVSMCDGIWWRFAQELSEFKAKNSDPSRSIRFVLVVDGDVSKELARLKKNPEDFLLLSYPQYAHLDVGIVNVRESAFANILAHALRSFYSDVLGRSNSEAFWRQYNDRLAFFLRVIDKLLLTYDTSDRASFQEIIIALLFDPLARQPSFDEATELELERAHGLLNEMVADLQTQVPENFDHRSILQNSVIDTYECLELLFATLSIESRLGFGIKTVEEPADPGTDRLREYHSPLVDRTIRRLVQGSYLSDAQAELAYKRLREFVRKARSVGAIVDSFRFQLLLLTVPRIRLESIPEIDDHIFREELVSRIEQEMNTHKAVTLEGFPRIGKTSLAAAIARRREVDELVFWYTADTDSQNFERLLGQFTYFVGQKANSKNLHHDWLDKKLSHKQAATESRKLLTGRSLLIVLDNCEVFADAQAKIVTEFLNLLLMGQSANIKAIAVYERASVFAKYVLEGMISIQVRGLNFQESVSFLKQHGCYVTPKNDMEFLFLVTKIDGHPQMLRIIASELQGTPSPQVVSNLRNELYDLNHETSLFFNNLWSHIEKLLTDGQKEVFYRLSLLLPFDRELCFVIAQCQPVVRFTPNDWRNLKVHVLEPRSNEKYEVPRLYKELSSSELTESLRQTVYATAANHVLQKQPISISDFQNGILYFVLAHNWEEAARYFMWAHHAENVLPYDDLSLLYAVFRGPGFQKSGQHPLLRFSVVIIELFRLLSDSRSHSTKSRVREIFVSLKQSLLQIEPSQASRMLSEIWKAYRQLARYYPEEEHEALLSTLLVHLKVADELEFHAFKVITKLAVATYYLERTKRYEKTFNLCTQVLSESIDYLDSQLMRDTLALKADSSLSQKDYSLALVDYQAASTYRPARGPITMLDLAIQECIGDCHWQLGNYRSAAAAYLKALNLRNRVPDFDQKRSLRLFGKLSAVYFYMREYLASIVLHAKMFSMYLHFEEDTMLVLIGGSLNSILSHIPGSRIDAETLDSFSSIEFASPLKMGPTFYSSTIRTDSNVLEHWLGRTSPAMFSYLLSVAFDSVGGIKEAINYAEAALSLPHETNFIPKPEFYFLVHLQIAELHLKNGDKLASATAIFNAMSLSDEYLKAQADLGPITGPDYPFSEQFQEKVQEWRLKLSHLNPYDVARPVFRNHIEPVILSEINNKSGFDRQATYFLELVQMTKHLPPSIAPAIEALVQMYFGIFLLTRNRHQESKLAIGRMFELIESHRLEDTKLHYQLHRTFHLAPLLSPTLADYADECIKTASMLCEQLPASEHLFKDFNESFFSLWNKSIAASDLQPTVPLRGLTEKLRQIKSSIPDPNSLFYHISALLVVSFADSGSEFKDIRTLQKHIVLQPLNQLDADTLFDLYRDYSSFLKRESQKAILGGNISRGEGLAIELAKVLSFAVKQYEKKLSDTQRQQLEKELRVAMLWSPSNSG